LHNSLPKQRGYRLVRLLGASATTRLSPANQLSEVAALEPQQRYPTWPAPSRLAKDARRVGPHCVEAGERAGRGANPAEHEDSPHDRRRVAGAHPEE